MNRKVLIGIALVGAVGVLLWANMRQLDGRPVGGQPKSQAQGPASAPLVKVMEIQKRGLVQEVLAPGVLEAGGDWEMRAAFSSKQVHLLVGMGERVTAGQVVAELDGSELATQVLMQEAQVARAEASLASLRLQESQAPVQLAQRLEQAQIQLVQAEDGVTAATRQAESLKQRLEQARASLALLQSRTASGSAQVEQARGQLVAAEQAYRASPLEPGVRESYEQARAAYEEALQQSQESARQATADLRRAYDELEAAEKEYARSGGEEPVALQLARSQVEAARHAVRLAEMEAESGGTVGVQVRAAEADLFAARATLAALREKLEKAVVKAPADGTVLAIAAREGQPVQEGQQLLLLGNLDQMKVTARVDEVDIGKVKPEQPLKVRSTAHPQSRFEGKVVRVSAQTAPPTAGSVGSFFEVEGQVANQDRLLRAGMNAEVTITADERESTIVVGLAAVREEGDKAYVLVVEEFKVKLRPVTIGLRTQTEVEILDGLQEGEQVIVSPFTLVNSLKDGDAVRTEKAEGDLP